MPASQPASRPAWLSYDAMAKAGDYGDVFAGGQELSGWAASERDFFLEALGGCARVLDLGCGPGFPSLALAAHVSEVVGVDASGAMLAQAISNRSARGAGNVVFVCALADLLPLPGRLFDGVAICGTLGSLDRPQPVLDELARVCAAGAIVASLEQDCSSRWQGEETETPAQWRLRMHDGELSAQRVRYCRLPDRIVTEVRRLREGAAKYPRLLALSASEPDNWPDAKADWHGLTRDDIAEEWVEVERQWRPDTLAAAFGRAGFALVRQEAKPSYNVPHIFTVFRCNGLGPRRSAGRHFGLPPKAP